MPWTYMLRCADGSYYIGSTWDLALRVQQHDSGKGAKYTSTRTPVELVWAEEHDRIDDAYRLEKQLQGWGRAKREALIRGDFQALPGLSSRAKRPRPDPPDRIPQR